MSVATKMYGFSYEFRDDYDGEVNECDIEHILSLMSQGYREGEIVSSDDKQNEHLGWWTRL